MSSKIRVDSIAPFSGSMLTISGSSTLGRSTYTDSHTVYGQLDITTTAGAILLPRMTTAQRDDAGFVKANGMLIYNTTTHKFQGYANGSWVDLH
jgi:hypothetical protein